MAGRDPSIMRALGLVAGDLWKVVTGRRPAFRQKAVVRRDVQETALRTGRGEVVLRRTTVDEVEVTRTPRSPNAPEQ